MTQALLDPLRFPLRGSALIEASAGTGKTFTIAALYLRLVLGHGGDAAFARALTPPEILVVTFTEAATKELRDRIRARLAEAADAFASGEDAIEPLLRELRSGCASRPNGWTRRPCPPSTAGATACCASTPSTAAACSARRWKPTRPNWNRKRCATTGAPSSTPCRPRTPPA
jgi:hypothetical protein